MLKLDDKEIRTSLISRLSTYKNNKIFEEVTVPSGRVRADVTAINGHVIAYEIKSDFDSIRRLKSQIPEYDKNFEMNYIVVGNKHFDSILNITPHYWGIILVEKTKKKTVKLSFVRRAKLNPNLSFSNFISLLSAKDIKKIASNEAYLNKEMSPSKLRNLFKQDIIDILDKELPKTVKNNLKDKVRIRLKEQ